MVDNTNNTGINTVILGPNGVDIVFTSVTLDFRTFLQFGPLMHRHGNTYMIISACFVVTSNKSILLKSHGILDVI